MVWSTMCTQAYEMVSVGAIYNCFLKYDNYFNYCDYSVSIRFSDLLSQNQMNTESSLHLKKKERTKLTSWPKNLYGKAKDSENQNNL